MIQEHCDTKEKEFKTARELGAEKEQLAARFLERNGIRILEKNFHSRFGEIDLVGWDGTTVIFTEVKYRKGTGYGGAEGAVTPSKQRKICRCADFYRYRKRIREDVSIRYDVVAICGGQIHWLQDAFPHRM